MDFTLDFPCVNCDGPIPWLRRKKIYCSNFCKEQARNIRWIRSTERRGVEQDEEIIEARKIRIAHLNNGGYIDLERRVPVETKIRVFEKSGHKCVQCNQIDDGTHEIDHVAGSSNNLDNLQLLCKKCHRIKTLNNINPIDKNDPRYDELKIMHKEMKDRIDSQIPIRPCDDSVNWLLIEKEISHERKKQYFSHLHNFIKKYIDKEISKNKLREYMNNSLIPTYTGHGKWSKNSINDLVATIKLDSE